MSKEQLINSVTDMLVHIVDRANLLIMTIGGSFIVLMNAYHIRKQSILDSIFESLTSFILGYSVGWITIKFTNNTSMMLTSALISCLASKSLINYFMLKTSTHVDNLIKGLINLIVKKK